jgi:molybdopterin molybdotransferase
MTDSFPTRIHFSEAQKIVADVAAANRFDIERVALSRASGRVLAEDLVATLALPGFDNSAMDGFALRSDEGVAPRRLIGEQFAGASRSFRIAYGQCLRITTGAPMPEGADAVLMKENARVEGEFVVPAQAIKAGTHVRKQGEDVTAGDRVIERGTALNASQLSLAAALGQHDLAVYRKPTVAIFTTGDELRAPGQPLLPGEIYDSNRVLLQTLLTAEGYEPVAWPVLLDNPETIAAALRDAAFSFDVVLTCGGVSAGEKDHLPNFLRREGRIHFWKVLMRPGMPLLFGKLGDAHFLGLPGNPVSVLATFLTLGRQLLDGLQGLVKPRPMLRARLSGDIVKTHDRSEFLRGLLSCDEHGQLQVQPNPADGSHRLLAAAQSNALIVLAEGAGQWHAGDVVEVMAYAGFQSQR